MNLGLIRSLDEKLRETGSATTTSCSENLLAKPLPEQNPLKEMMHTSPFISSEPVLLGFLESSEEYDSEDSLHFCEEEHSSSPLIEFEPLPDGLESDVLDLDRDTTMIFHDEPLEMENQWAMEFCEVPTLESEKRIPQMSMGVSLLTYHENHAHSMQLQSQACLVHRAHTRTTTTLWSSSAKFSEGWLQMYMFIVNIADFVRAP